MKISKAVLQELELPWDALEDRITGHGRCSTHHEIIFELDGKYYRTGYSVGSTEMQEERPWEDQTEVECEEVTQVEKVIKVWEPVNDKPCTCHSDDNPPVPCKKKYAYSECVNE